MARKSKEKPKSIDDAIDRGVEEIISYYGSHRDADFETRRQKFEEFHSYKDGAIPTLILNHAIEVVHGDPSDREKNPGAYDAGYKRLDRTVERDLDKVEKDEDVVGIIEAYVDQFFEKALYQDTKKRIEHAKAEGLSDEDIRKIKGMIFSKYHRDERGASLNPFDHDFIKNWKGKTKAELKLKLRQFADKNAQDYLGSLAGKIKDALLKEEDHLDLAKHLKSTMDSAGYEHEDHPLTMEYNELLNHWVTYLKTGDLSKLGWRKKEKKKEEN